LAANRNEQSPTGGAPAAPVLATEVLRIAASPAEAKAAPKTEEGPSPFWRIFGGTVLSVLALVAVTLYQQLSNGLNDVRREIEQRTSRDEFVTSRSKVWDKLHEIQAAGEHANVAVADRCARLEQQARDAETGRAQAQEEMKWLREAAVSALKDRSALLEQQVKAGQAEHQETLKELRRLRARLAELERRQAAGPPGKPASQPGE
jgi:hypothetical protein